MLEGLQRSATLFPKMKSFHLGKLLLQTSNATSKMDGHWGFNLKIELKPQSSTFKGWQNRPDSADKEGRTRTPSDFTYNYHLLRAKQTKQTKQIQ